MTWARKGKTNYYIVPCPFCKADVGTPCFQVSHLQYHGTKKWILHQKRVHVYEAQFQGNSKEDVKCSSGLLEHQREFPHSSY